MPITPTYPGVYIEELPGYNHSVTAAPTSVTVFIGYTHPFKTVQPNTVPPQLNFNKAIEIFSFADYQANFGGFFSFGSYLPDYVGNAVFQFFSNGGSDAWVIGLQAALPQASASIDMSAGDSPTAVQFTALEPGGVYPAPTQDNPGTSYGAPTTVQLVNVRKDSQGNENALADIIITYSPPSSDPSASSFSSRVETYRAVPANSIADQLAQSVLVEVQKPPGSTLTAFPESSAGNNLNTYTLSYPADPNLGNTTTLIKPGDYDSVFQAGASLDVDVPIFNLMVLPGMSPVGDAQSAVLSEALAFCEQKRAFFIMDAPPNATTSSVSPLPEQATPAPSGTPAQVAMDDFWNGRPTGTWTPPPIPVSANGAIYFPYLNTIDPLTQQQSVSPASGFVAGIFAQEDASWSVGKAPAGLETTINGASGVVAWGRMTDMQQGVLNGNGVNCLRDFPGMGTVVFGARTLVSQNPAFEQWKYVPVRRTALFIEQSLYGSLGWAVFQPNDTPLWNALTQEVNAFMLTLFRQGSYFQGSTPSEAFLVQCDSTTTTQADIDAGVVNILVGFAPLKPAEFVIVQITQLAGQTQT